MKEHPDDDKISDNLKSENENSPDSYRPFYT